LNRTYIIKKKDLKFEAAHRLHNLNYESPCKSIHGHSYTVSVTVGTKSLDENGMVIDFTKLKLFQKWLDEEFDHSLIVSENDKELIDTFKNKNQKICIFPKEITTSELMSEVLFNELYKGLLILIDKSILSFIEVEVFETKRNSAIYRVDF
jgi:6-pyruvoyltetrahydropterin/6-carboxytetrahydropterin synthase